ncbi:cadherin-23-like isoform X2 [Mercenaria mercenaria]|uniref:cadherin-23-like isoform X2 n=1 Tax=Mercenaria mercenaria TaxID=6596 RepID=UPI00234F62A7|nr:cadherin-23-like isoform X2 [Mercenaria mercenaria]
MCQVLHRCVLLLSFLTQVLCNNGPMFSSQPPIIKPEDTPINSTIGTLMATDDDGPQELKFSIPAGHVTEQYVRLDNVRGVSTEGRKADIVLIKKLDRDFTQNTFIKLRFVVEDNPGAEGNIIVQEITLYIRDVNDEKPIFRETRYEKDVLENAASDFLVVTVKADDPDTGEVIKYSMEPVGQAISDDYKNAFKIDQTSGEVTVNRKLDANIHNYYEYTLIASDVGNKTGQSVLLIKVVDVQDKPPYFTNLPYSTSIFENATASTQVVQVTALDGDKGASNTVSYSFVGGQTTNFDIDSTSGWITVKSSLDRDAPDVRQSGGVYAIYVKARENDNTQAEDQITATTLVTITVKDVNDNKPKFNSQKYEAFILENMQEGVPITFSGPDSISFMNVSDIDQGLFSHFQLSLEKNGQPYNDFAPLPSEVFVESSVLIRVQNSTALDYEKITDVTFQIVAREIGTKELWSSTADITVNIQDMNDNSPVFQPETLPTLTMLENATVGTELTILTATDADRGNFGKITYHIRGSNQIFQIDETTGRITLAASLDREKVDNYFLTAEARDGGGLTTFINLDIKVLDVNDKNPVFRREEQFVTVREDSLQFLRGNLVVEATDDDEPNTPNSEIMYRITKASAGLKNKFFVNQTSGLITMVEKIDYEALPASLNGRVLLEVEAYDLGIPSLSTTVNVTVEIEDVNDNAPVFSPKTYTASVPESATAGVSVVKVSATDADSSKPNNQFLYRIDSGAGDKFRIDFQTGDIVIEVGAKLDRETKDNYILNVSATDRGAVPMTGLCIVNITVLDVNDEPPVFTPSTISTSINENSSPGDQVVCTTATDPDSTHTLQYSIVPSSIQGSDENGKAVNVTTTGVQNYFTINKDTGCITVQNQPDRETAETVVFNAMVRDILALTGPGTKEQTAIASITMTLLDYNDNSPEFLPNASYNLKISEGLEPQSEVLRFETRDKDKNQQISYQMDKDPNNNFIVTENSGILRLNKALDREETDILEVTVLAMDDVDPKRTSTATVLIHVQDINDNTPEFTPYNLSYKVKEDAEVGQPIVTISASDKDLGEYGKVVYSFDVSNDDDKLKINRLTGIISVAKKLDRETRSSYTLYVTAVDNPDNPNNQRTNQTKAITIEVEDVNDNDPEFTNIDENTRASVLENAWDPNKEGPAVFSVSAEDKDVGENARLVYTISANETVSSLFTIETVSRTIGGVPKYFGDIRVASNLLGNVGDLHLNVTVTDQGVPPRSAQTGLIIVVEDVNLHQPVFTSPTGPRAEINTNEKNPVGSIVFQIEATDEDHGRNSKITYEIQEENDWEVFSIHPETGLLTNKVILDRETKERYEIKIKAEDNGVPNPLHSTLTLIIMVLDIDDNVPEFTVPRNKPYKIQIEEERVHDQTTTGLNIAVDKDSGDNAIICYYIIGGNKEVSSHFQLDQKGNLTLTKSFDRENLTVPYINMIVMATPSCYADIAIDTSLTSFPPSGYAGNLSLLWVQVEIQDINDNPPKFKQSVLTLGVTRDTGFGMSITNLQDLVTDEDATMKVDFAAVCTEHHLQNKKLECTSGQNPKSQPFLVFKNGTVATNTYFQANMYGYYLIHIQAKENVTGGEPFIANATLRISLINDDQRVKVVFRNTPDIVRSFQVAFTQKLQQTTGYRIVVDKIQTHENRYGLPEINKTDMFIHGENMKTNETISAQELLRVIDSFAEALLGLRYDYKVLEIVPTTTAKEEQSLEDTFKMALILVTIGLTLLCVGLCIVFYISRQQYKRKLKAATAMAYATAHNGTGTIVSQCSSSDLHKSELPGTNVHAYENTNPIYLEKVLLEEAGERDDDDDDSLDDNAVDPTQPSQFSEQQMSMNFYTEDNNLNKVPQSKLGNGDAILNAVLQNHQNRKMKNGDAVQNGQVENKEDNFAGLPTTEI